MEDNACLGRLGARLASESLSDAIGGEQPSTKGQTEKMKSSEE